MSQPLGQPLPASEHAISVSLPAWQDVIDYEEGLERVLGSLQAGYPRFFLHPYVQALCKQASSEFDLRSDQACLPFPSMVSAQRALAFCAGSGQIVTGLGGLSYVVIERGKLARLRKYWQHTGEMISSRQAKDILFGNSPQNSLTQITKLKARLASLYQVDSSAVFLYGSGMNAFFALQQAAFSLSSSRLAVQFGFPYTDTLSVQKEFGECVLLDCTDFEGLAALSPALVCTEVPSNPLLKTTDLRRLFALCQSKQCPLIVDDTIATPINLRLLPHCDVLWCSLSKSFSGAGDVLAGAIILNPESAFAERFAVFLRNYSETDRLFAADAIVLEQNSRDFAERVQASNRGALEVVEYLACRPETLELHHPSLINKGLYESLLAPSGGFGSLFSLRLAGGEQAASCFYDALALAKGPSLGNSFSLVCPYVLLAHYGELEAVGGFGLARELLRFSIGVESAADLIEVIEAASPMKRLG